MLTIGKFGRLVDYKCGTLPIYDMWLPLMPERDNATGLIRKASTWLSWLHILPVSILVESAPWAHVMFFCPSSLLLATNLQVVHDPGSPGLEFG